MGWRSHNRLFIVVELSDEEIAELRDEHGVESWEKGDFLTSPRRVECGHCHVSFDTEEFKAEPE